MPKPPASPRKRWPARPSCLAARQIFCASCRRTRPISHAGSSVSSAVRQPNVGAVSDVKLRNLATIKTSMTNECNYCTTHTSVYGQALGVSEAQLEAMKSDAWKTSPLFNERERATVAWAEAVTLNTAKSDKKLWETMKRLFSDAEIVEITTASAMFNMINRLNDTFWTELETVEYNRRQGNAVKGVTVADIETFASGFAAAGEAQRRAASSVAAE